MSHATVAVIVKKERVTNLLNTGAFTNLEDVLSTIVDNMMEPFDESMEVAPYPALTPEQLKVNFNNIMQRSKDKNDKWGQAAKKAGATKNPQAYLKWYYDDYEFNDDGFPLTTYNPNSKWDWYQIGGRWSNLITTTTGEHVNFCQLKDLVRKEELSEDRKEELRREYEYYTTDDWSEELKAWANEHRIFKFYKTSYYKEKYPTYKVYENLSVSFSTYALLNSKGEWIEPGQMGWFGLSSATATEEREFQNKYNAYLDAEDQENYIVIVDYHI